MTIRLSPEEVALRDALSRHLGITPSGVMRQALLRMARAEEVKPEAPRPKR